MTDDKVERRNSTASSKSTKSSKSSKSSKSATSEKAMMASSEPGKEVTDSPPPVTETVTVHVESKKIKMKMPPAMSATLQRVMPTDEQKSSWNIGYLKSPRGLLKVIALAVTMLLFCLAIGAGTGGGMWSAFMSFSLAQFTFGLLLLHVIFPHLLDDKRNAMSIALLELVGYAIATLTFLIVFLTMVFNSIGYYYNRGSSIVAVIFAIILTALCAVLTFLNFIAWRNEQAVLKGEQTHTSVP